MIRRKRNVIYSVALLVAVSATAAAQEAEKPAADQPKPDQSSQPFAFGLSRKGTATVEDAYRLFLTMAVGHRRVELHESVRKLSYEQVSAQLELLCVIDGEWGFEPQTCLRRDVLAYMCAAYMGCRPGLITGVCGMTRRYAHREMAYQRIVPPGAPGTLVSGPELLSVLTRVERRMQSRRDVQLTDDEIH